MALVLISNPYSWLSFLSNTPNCLLVEPNTPFTYSEVLAEVLDGRTLVSRGNPMLWWPDRVDYSELLEALGRDVMDVDADMVVHKGDVFSKSFNSYGRCNSCTGFASTATSSASVLADIWYNCLCE